MMVTDESIARVPRIESDVLDERHWDTLQQKHRELLAFIRDDEFGTEAIAYYTMDMQQLAKDKGEPGAWRVFPKNFDVPHIVMHTHPAGGPFSLNDFHPFITNQNTMMMCAVGHDISVYTLEKLPGFEAANAIHTIIDAARKAPDPRIDLNGHIEFVIEVYKSIQKYGFVYREG